MIILSWLFFTLTYALSVFAARSATVPQMLFFRNIVSLLIVLPWMIYHGPESFKTSRFGLLLARSLASLASLGFMFIAIQKTSLADATLLINSSPLFVPFVVAIWLKKSINHRLWPVLIIGFFGIGLILRPNIKIFDSGALFALAAGITTAISIVAIRLTTTTEKIHTVLFYLFLISAVAALPLTFFYWESLNTKTVLELILMGILAAIAQALFVKACHFATASQLAPFSYSAVLFAGLIDFFVWGKVPDWIACLGIFLVCFAGILIIWLTQPKKLSTN